MAVLPALGADHLQTKARKDLLNLLEGVRKATTTPRLMYRILNVF